MRFTVHYARKVFHVLTNVYLILLRTAAVKYINRFIELEKLLKM